MKIFFVLFLLSRSLSTLSLPSEELHKIFDPKILNIHGLTSLESVIHNAHKSLESESRPYFVCGPRSTLKKKANVLLHESESQPQTAYMKKSSDSACLLVHLTTSTASELKTLNDDWHYHPLPAILKIHHSVIINLSKLLDLGKKISSSLDAEKEFSKIAEAMTLTIDYSSGSHEKKISSRRLSEKFVRSLTVQSHQPSLDESKPWLSLVEEIQAYDGLGNRQVESELDCALPASVIVQYYDNSVVFSDLRNIQLTCLVGIIEMAALDSSVLRVSMGTRPKTLNFETRGVTQSGTRGIEPYSEAGLTGSGQVVGMADSGINDLSCFFLDDSGAYSSLTTSRAGVLEPLRRKIISYSVAADKVDDNGGHGSHVAGTIAGYSTEYSVNHGMAPDAKIAFYDIGYSNGEYLTVPPLSSELFPKAYAAGARVHTNSWGDLGALYSQSAYDVDAYSYQNPDFLIFFAAGNSGQDGPESIGCPASSKNSLAVGALSLHDPITDVPHAESTVAYFSSIGPTYDGRIKPDISAPGDYTMSAYSSPPPVDATGNTLSYEESTAKLCKGTCAVIQMSGTSMATPAVAGTSVLIRQYFMDPKFWASTCNSAYSACASGSFVPTGYFLKAAIIHSGQAVDRYSIPVYNKVTRLPSQSLGTPPDNFQGHGSLTLSNILPLADGRGLDPALDLVVWDKLRIAEQSTLKWVITISKEAAVKGLKVTLVWFDPPSPLYSSSQLLIHDIDLLVIGPDGTKHWGNRVSNGDEINTSEQVHIYAAGCVEESQCTFSVYVHAHILPESDYQDVAVVMTTSGFVTGPTVLVDEWFKPDVVRPTPHPSHSFESYDLEIDRVLSGGMIANKTVNVQTCNALEWVEVRLHYDPLQSIKSLPRDTQIVVLDPNRRSISIGGSDLSYPATATSVWSNEWYSDGVSRSGLFNASVGVKEINLHSSGQWTFFLYNAWSKSLNVSYRLHLKLHFKGGGGSCAPSSQPTRFPTAAPSLTALPTAPPTLTAYVPIKVPIPTAQRTNRKVGNNTFTPIWELLSTFKQPGQLKGVHFQLYGDANVTSLRCKVFSILVTSPNGHIVQLGGHHSVFGASNHFYRRSSPDAWPMWGAEHGKGWSAYRDVTVAGAIAAADSQADWKVEVSLAFSEYQLIPRLMWGDITLYFDTFVTKEKASDSKVSGEGMPSANLILVYTSCSLLIVAVIAGVMLTLVRSQHVSRLQECIILSVQSPTSESRALLRDSSGGEELGQGASKPTPVYGTITAPTVVAMASK